MLIMAYTTSLRVASARATQNLIQLRDWRFIDSEAGLEVEEEMEEFIKNMFEMQNEELKVYIRWLLFDLLVNRTKNINDRCNEVIRSCDVLKLRLPSGVKHVLKTIIDNCNYIMKNNSLLSDDEYEDILFDTPLISYNSKDGTTIRVLFYLARNTIMYAECTHQ
jgi:hypothetical protein